MTDQPFVWPIHSQPDMSQGDIGPWFNAAFDGECAEGHTVDEGDEIRYVDGELECRELCDGADE